MADQALIYLQLLMRAVAEDNKERVKKFLNLISIDRLAPEKITSLFNRLLTTAAESNCRNVVDVIIQAFEPNYPDRFQLPLLNQILMDLGLDDEVVVFVLESYPEKSYLSLALDFIKWRDDPNIVPGLTRLEDIKGPLEISEYRELYNTASTSNLTAAEFFAYQLNTRSDYAEIPSWVKNFTEEEEIPREDELIIPEPGPFIFDLPKKNEDVVELLTDGLRLSGKSEEEVELAQSELRKNLVASTQQEKAQLVHGALKNNARVNLADDEELFALLGPTNTIVDSDLTDDEGLCRKYGGCRMLCCIEFEDFLTSGDEVVYPIDQYKSTDWFTGYCQVCHLRIRRPAHAIRMPLDHGGWKGCYCSERCLRKDIPVKNKLVEELVNEMMIELDKIGIQDRIPVEEKEEEEEN